MSMQKIYKQSINSRAVEQTLEMPKGSEIIAFQMQEGWPTIWYKFNVEQEFSLEDRVFVIVPTGNPFGWYCAVDYVGTFQTTTFPIFVGHLFELGRPHQKIKSL